MFLAKSIVLNMSSIQESVVELVTSGFFQRIPYPTIAIHRPKSTERNDPRPSRGFNSGLHCSYLDPLALTASALSTSIEL